MPFFHAANLGFDYEAFIRRAALVLIHFKGKSFAQLAGEVETVRKEYALVRDRSARQYIRRHIANDLLWFALVTVESQRRVDALYQRAVRLGFNDPHTEVAAATGYASHCAEQGAPKKGLHALLKAKDSIPLHPLIVPGKTRSFLKPINSMIRQLRKACR